MHAQSHTIAFWGIETIAVTLQTHIANSLPSMAIVGLAGDDRVDRAALAEALAYRALPLLS